MADLLKQMDNFQQYAREQIVSGVTPSSLDKLYDDWRKAHPHDGDVLAVRASLRDMDQGETGRPFDEFDQEFRLRNGLPPVSP